MTRALTYVEVDVDEWGSGDSHVDGTLEYNFTDNALHGWTARNFTLTAGFDGATMGAITAADTNWVSPTTLTINGGVSRYVFIDIERTALRADGTWDGFVFYVTSGHAESGSFFKRISLTDPVPNIGDRATFTLDMWALDGGGTDWKDNTITQIRLDFDQSLTGKVKVYSVRVGPLGTNRAADFDGTNDYLTRGSGFTGAVDSSKFMLSFWVYLTQTGATEFILAGSSALAGSGNMFRVGHFSSGVIFLVANNSAGTEVFHIDIPGTVINQWSHYMVSVDLNDPSSLQVYVEGQPVSPSLIAFVQGGVIDFTIADWAVGAEPTSAFKLNGAIADLWLNPGTYLDLSMPANQHRYFSHLSGPVDMGKRGEVPIGSAPMVFLSGPSNSWDINKGFGGGFVLHGALTDWFQLPETHRFAQPADYLPSNIYAVPSIKGVEFNPVTVSLGEDLGQRASITITLTDHKHKFKLDDYNKGTFWGKWRGRYLTKFRNKAFRIIRGVLGQAITDMDTRHYFVDTVDGPAPTNATYTIIAKDALKLADDDRSQAPRLSDGSLAGSINNAVTSATLNPVGIGNIEYPASGFICFGGKEVVSFTRAGDVLTIVRAQRGTIAIAHNAGDRAQLVLDYSGNDLADILYDLFINYVDGIIPAYINLSEWKAETAAYLDVLYQRTITEPTSVKKLIAEAIDQAAISVWWDDQAQKIRLKVLRQIATDAKMFGEDVIVAQSIGVKDQPTKRISQQWTYYGQRDPTNQSNDEDNFRATLASVDGVLETAYGAPAISKTLGKWVTTINSAQRLNGIKLSRFRDPPRAFSFQLFRDQIIALGEGYQLSWSSNQDSLGNEVPAPIQITKLRYETDYIYVEAEEMLASGVITVTNTVFLTNTGGLLSFTVPLTWNNASNSIETLGAGGGGDGLQGAGGSGGGGGAYSSKINQTLTPGGSVSYRVGAPGLGAVSASGTATDGGDTWFNGANLAASMVGAKGGKGAVFGPGQGGQASAGIGTTKFSGGDGGPGSPSGESRAGGGGGGGAAGPNGNGGKGGTNPSSHNDAGCGGGAADGGSDGVGGVSNIGGNGGNNRFLFGGGTASQPTGQQGGGGRGSDSSGSGTAGGEGGEGQQIWTQTIAPILAAGPGGGGGGGGSSVAGKRGGLYGGGGGGGGQSAAGGDGRQGIIVLTWKV